MRLKKGQAPRSAEIRHEQTKETVYARYELLRIALKDPKKVSTSILVACQSQGKLAALELAKHRIYPISLNTMRSVADIVIENGGWQTLDNFRRSLYQQWKALKKESTKPKRGTKKAQKAAETKIKGQLNNLMHDYHQLHHAYLDLLKIIGPIAKEDCQLKEKLQRHRNLFSIQEGLRVVKRSETK